MERQGELYSYSMFGVERLVEVRAKTAAVVDLVCSALFLGWAACAFVVARGRATEADHVKEWYVATSVLIGCYLILALGLQSHARRAQLDRLPFLRGAGAWCLLTILSPVSEPVSVACLTLLSLMVALHKGLELRFVLTGLGFHEFDIEAVQRFPLPFPLEWNGHRAVPQRDTSTVTVGVKDVEVHEPYLFAAGSGDEKVAETR